MQQHILALDISGTPFDWLSIPEAAGYYATKKVAWDLGDTAVTLRGGHNHLGIQSTLEMKPIMAISKSERMRKHLAGSIPLGNDNTLLFKRDRYTCGYCGRQLKCDQLSRDHILAQCRGGTDIWENCITACRKCNQEKGKKLVQDFRPLMFVPYVPCRFEHYLLSGRNILADQHDYLAARLPGYSRVIDHLSWRTIC